MKINENATLIPTNPGVGKPTPGSNSASVNNAATKATDEALIEKLRAKVAAGEFEIDYKKISQAMLKDVVASIGQKPNRA